MKSRIRPVPDEEKNFDDMYNRFNRIPALDEQTDGQKSHINIACQLLTRDKKVT